MTWQPASTDRPWFRPEAHDEHEPPSLHRVPLPSGSPACPLRCGSPAPWPRRRRLRFPSPPSTAGTSACSFPPRRAPVRAPSALGFAVRGPPPAIPTEGPGSLGLPGRPASDAPRAPTPPDARPPRPLAAAALLPSEMPTSWAAGILALFGAALSSARMLTFLRINRPVTGQAARSVTGLPGSALTGRDSHPLDDSSDFSSGITSPGPVGPTLPDRFRQRCRKQPRAEAPPAPQATCFASAQRCSRP